MAEFYLLHEYWFAAVQLILAMLGMGATLTGKDFRDVIREPLAVSLGTAIQLLAVPVTAFLFLRFIGVADGVAVGIALIAAIPGGTVSNIFTFFARGNSALSISITAITTLACLVSTPFILSLLISEYLPADFTMPRGQIVSEIALTLLLPLAIGMLYLYLYPRTAPILSKWSIRGSLLGILLIVLGSAAAGRLDITAFGYDNILLVTAEDKAIKFALGYIGPQAIFKVLAEGGVIATFRDGGGLDQLAMQAVVELFRQQQTDILVWISLPCAEIQGDLLHKPKPLHVVRVQVRENEVIDLLDSRAVQLVGNLCWGIYEDVLVMDEC